MKGPHKDKDRATVSTGHLPPDPSLHHAYLKSRQRAIRDGFPTSLTLRVHRSLSWYGRACDEAEDADVRFILLWIAFNAAYASDIDIELSGDRERFQLFFRTLVGLDEQDQIYGLVWSRFSNEIRMLLDNQYVFAPFWAHQNGQEGQADWQARLQRSKQRISRALAERDTPLVLSILFDRLYVLRNQLVHGGATWASSVNRDQVRDGSAVLINLVPIFIHLMMEHPDHGWGMPYYPVID